MHQTVNQDAATTIGSLAHAQAWRLTFEDSPKDESSSIAVHEPRKEFGALTPVQAPDLLRQEPLPDEQALDLIWVPTTSDIGREKALDAETWIARGARVPGRAPLRAGIRTVHALWTEKRALLYAAPSSLPDALDALVRFTATALAVERLEAAMQRTWEPLESDVPLAQAGGARHAHRRPHIDRMSGQVTMMKFEFMRLRIALEQHDTRLSDVSRRLFAELAHAAGLHDRLDLLEGPIEFANAQYELITTRLIEGKAAYTGFRLELAIAALLALETIVLLLQSEWNALLHVGG